MTRSDIHLEVLADPDLLARRAAEWITVEAKGARGAFALALSGGTTPSLLYRDLADLPWREAIPWERAQVFWGDERFVPPADPRSNYRMAREALLAHVPIPEGNVHPVPTVGLTPQAGAARYERVLQSFYGAERLDPDRPLFAVTLLGLGPEGHTASLFPGTPVLQERLRWTAAVTGVKAEARITLTYPTLASSRALAFLVAGEGKRDVLARFLRGDPDLPASGVHPQGELWVFCDRAAMGE